MNKTAIIIGPKINKQQLQQWRRAAVVVGIFTPDHSNPALQNERYLLYNLNTRKATPNSSEEIIKQFYNLVVTRFKAALPQLDPAKQTKLIALLTKARGDVITCPNCGKQTSAQTGTCVECKGRLPKAIRPTYKFEKNEIKQLLTDKIITADDVLQIWKDEPISSWEQKAWLNNELARHPSDMFRTDKGPLNLDPDQIGFPKEGLVAAEWPVDKTITFVNQAIKPKIIEAIAAGKFDDWLGGGELRANHKRHWLEILGLTETKESSTNSRVVTAQQDSPIVQFNIGSNQQLQEYYETVAEQLIDQSAAALAEIVQEQQAAEIEVEEPELAAAASLRSLSKFAAVDNLETIEDIIEYLINDTPLCTTMDAAHDHILVEVFFPMIGPRFYHEADIYEDDVDFFKQNFPYEKYLGDKAEKAKEKIENYRSIQRIIDTIVSMMKQNQVEKIAKQHIKTVYFEKNFNKDLQKFKQSINRKYWYS